MNNCSIKDKIALGSAVIALFFGMSLTLAGFIIEPTGEVHESVLWVLGQMLLYAGGILGVTTYMTSKMSDFEKIITKKYEEEK